MSNFDIKFIEQAEQTNFYVNDPKDADKPKNWRNIKKYENPRTGFKAEAFIDENGQKVFVIAGTNRKSLEDWKSNYDMFRKRIPQQANDAFLAYEEFNDRYGDGDTIVVGYSLGGSVAQILCNETGARGLTFEAFGVGDIVKPKHTAQIENYGNESDIIFNVNRDKLLGTNYIIPDDERPLNKRQGIDKHMPNQIGDVSKAVKQEERYQQAKDNSYILDGYLSKNYYNYDDSLFDVSNKVFYENSGVPMKDRSPEEIEQIVNQYYDNNEKLPAKSELDRRVRFGELIYVENYTRSDGTKVSGYYRRYPEK